MKVNFLSYPIAEQVPKYGQAEPQQIVCKEIKSLEKGDSSYGYSVCFENHVGTHVDLPAHFFSDGEKVMNYKADRWVFNSPQLVEITITKGQLIQVQDLEGKINTNTDLLLIKSGWGKFRGNLAYTMENPGVHENVAHYLRTSCPKVRALGFDWISLSSYLNREEGRKAHRAFLDPRGTGRPLFIIEDMDLSQVSKSLTQVIISPLRIEAVDSVPCTVLGFHD